MLMDTTTTTKTGEGEGRKPERGGAGCASQTRNMGDNIYARLEMTPRQKRHGGMLSRTGVVVMIIMIIVCVASLCERAAGVQDPCADFGSVAKGSPYNIGIAFLPNSDVTSWKSPTGQLYHPCRNKASLPGALFSVYAIETDKISVLKSPRVAQEAAFGIYFPPVVAGRRTLLNATSTSPSPGSSDPGSVYGLPPPSSPLVANETETSTTPPTPPTPANSTAGVVPTPPTPTPTPANSTAGVVPTIPFVPTAPTTFVPVAGSMTVVAFMGTQIPVMSDPFIVRSTNALLGTFLLMFAHGMSSCLGPVCPSQCHIDRMVSVSCQDVLILLFRSSIYISCVCHRIYIVCTTYPSGTTDRHGPRTEAHTHRAPVQGQDGVNAMGHQSRRMRRLQKRKLYQWTCVCDAGGVMFVRNKLCGGALCQLPGHNRAVLALDPRRICWYVFSRKRRHIIKPTTMYFVENAPMTFRRSSLVERTLPN